MPIPTPGENESDVDFMHRCVSNPTMRNEYPDRNQRIAVCLDQLNASKDILKQYKPKLWNQAGS